MTGLHREKQEAQHPETDSSVEGGVYGALTLLLTLSTLCKLPRPSTSRVKAAAL